MRFHRKGLSTPDRIATEVAKRLQSQEIEELRQDLMSYGMNLQLRRQRPNYHAGVQEAGLAEGRAWISVERSIKARDVAGVIYST